MLDADAQQLALLALRIERAQPLGRGVASASSAAAARGGACGELSVVLIGAHRSFRTCSTARRASSLIRLGSQGGSHTVSTSQSGHARHRHHRLAHLLGQFLRARAARRGQRHFHLHLRRRRRCRSRRSGRVRRCSPGFPDRRRWRRRRSPRPRSAAAPVSPSGVQAACSGVRRALVHSLLASFAPSSAASSACHGSVAHFTRDGIFVHAGQRLQAAPAPLRAASHPGMSPVRAISRNAANSARASARPRPGTASAIRSAEATLMAQPRASNPVSAMRAVGVVAARTPAPGRRTSGCRPWRSRRTPPAGRACRGRRPWSRITS